MRTNVKVKNKLVSETLKNIQAKNDIGTAQRHAKGDVELHGSRAYVQQQDALSFYLARDIIGKRHYGAGMRLYADFMVAHRSATGLVMSPDDLVGRPPKGSGGRMGDGRMAAFDSYNHALMAVGKVSARILFNVCIEGKKMPEFIEEFKWNRKNTGVDRMKEALDDLADYYRVLWEEQKKLEEHKS